MRKSPIQALSHPPVKGLVCGVYGVTMSVTSKEKGVRAWDSGSSEAGRPEPSPFERVCTSSGGKQSLNGFATSALMTACGTGTRIPICTTTQSVRQGSTSERKQGYPLKKNVGPTCSDAAKLGHIVVVPRLVLRLEKATPHRNVTMNSDPPSRPAGRSRALDQNEHVLLTRAELGSQQHLVWERRCVHGEDAA